MPIYEYKCTACGYQFEKLQKVNDNPLTLCPHCQKPKLKKLISAANFHLKGSGWYKTDYKNEKPKAAPSQETAQPTDNDKKTDTKDKLLPKKDTCAKSEGAKEKST